jgi:hypothetical protein
MVRHGLWLLAVASLLPGGGAVAAAPSTPQPAELVTRNTYAFAYDDASMSGGGADFLRTQTATAQFVLLGEDHMDHATPVFAGALLRMLHDAHGYRHLAVEQDPVAIEDASRRPLRGDAERIAAHAARWPGLFEFDTDEDLALLARAGTLLPGEAALWGCEQATGASRYLEELVRLAPDAGARRRAEAMLAAARAADPGPRYSVNWLIAPTTSAEVAALAESFAAAPGSQAARLLDGLARSAEIFGYYRRAEAGEFVGLYNNTVREQVLKANFLEHYRRAAARGGLPKVLFKFGSNHLYHGKNPTQAFPLGNLAHELAIANGSQAYGLMVLFLGEGYRSYADYPAWLRPLLPATEPRTPVVVDLRALRPYQRLFREAVEPAAVWEQRAVLHGYDAIVLLPGSRPGTVTGREPRQ